MKVVNEKGKEVRVQQQVMVNEAEGQMMYPEKDSSK
jgi:hypothetical protein